MKYDFNIVTLHRAQNYGAALQAYALQTHLVQLGFNAGIYDAEQILAPVNRDFRSFIIKSINNASKSLNKKKYEEYQKRFLDFINENFNINKCEDSKVFIAGSDQIWNPIVFNPSYYLDFVKTNAIKASYAASIGVLSIPKDKSENYRKSLSTFDYISVRELDAKNELERITARKDIRVDLDPSFLLSKDTWINLSYNGECLVNGNYILLYLLHIPKNINLICRWLKKELNCKVVLIGIWNLSEFRVSYDLKLKIVGPYDFLALIRDAKAVITTSFHGTAFSIIFEKEFYSIVNSSFPSRINNVLQHFKIKPVSETQTEFERASINYNEVAGIISINRESSDKYFNEIINAYKKAKS